MINKIENVHDPKFFSHDQLTIPILNEAADNKSLELKSRRVLKTARLKSPGELNELAVEKVARNEALELSNALKNIEADKLATAEAKDTAKKRLFKTYLQKLSRTNHGELKGVSEEAKEHSDASTDLTQSAEETALDEPLVPASVPRDSRSMLILF